MKLITNELRERLPALGSTADQPNPLALCKFFTPDSSWTWYVVEFDGDDICYGLVDGLDVEFSTFRISELEAVRGHLGLPVERDLYFTATPVTTLYNNHRGAIY